MGSQKVPESRKTPLVRSPILDDSQVLRFICTSSHLALPKDPEQANFQLGIRLVKTTLFQKEKKYHSTSGNASFRDSSECEDGVRMVQSAE